MSIQNTLKEVLISQREIFENDEEVFTRSILKDFYEKYNHLNSIIAITGLRRSGKSHVLRLIKDEILQKEKIQDENWLYLNFEDTRLIDLEAKDYMKIIESHQEIYGVSEKKLYLFLDEIQEAESWEKWLHLLREMKKYKIYITGSNSKLLASELASSLTGRTINIELFPCSFHEYICNYKKIKLDEKSFYGKEKIQLIKHFKEYLIYGGMPEYMIHREPLLIHNYFKDIIEKDVVIRYGIKNKKNLFQVANFLNTNIKSINSLENIKDFIGIKNLTTVKNYISHLESTYLFFSVPKFDPSLKKQIYNPDKFYIADIAFYNLLAFKLESSIGIAFENLVFNQLKSSGDEIYYYKTKSGKEVDFFVNRNSLIQVCYDLTQAKTLNREVSSLLEAMQETKLKKAILINNDLEKEEKYPEGTISYIPLWKWLLSQ